MKDRLTFFEERRPGGSVDGAINCEKGCERQEEGSNKCDRLPPPPPGWKETYVDAWYGAPMVMFREWKELMKGRTEEGAVGCVDNRVYLEACYVALAAATVSADRQMRHNGLRQLRSCLSWWPAGIRMEISL